ncbi:MAG: CPBP family intramembrane metalloprotease [Deferribacterales bacterium]|jgi:hypothetical protein|nr:CPBP family intramembrane metalloprotease [Deferribacterales bacterium]
MQPYKQNVNGKEKGYGIPPLAISSLIPVLASILLILCAEFLLFSGIQREAILIHTFVLIVVSIGTVQIKDKQITWVLQALMLLPLLRLINFSMPVFSTLVLYRYFYVYIPLFIPIFVIIRHQGFSMKQLGLSFKNILLYFPLSIVIGLVIAQAEYFIAPVSPLIRYISLYNMIDIFLIMIFCVGLVEELIFRSILQTRLEGLFGSIIGLIITSLLFGVMSPVYGTIYGIVFSVVTGLILGSIFMQTRSLPFVALIHGFSNVFLFGVIPFLGPGLGVI